MASVFEFSAAGVPSTGEVPSGLPSLAGPALRLRDVDGIFPLATGCLLLAYVESISAARTFAAKHGYTLDPQQEFLGIGAANLAAALSHGYPVAGGLSQTAGVTDHVRMNLEGQSGLPVGSLHHPVEDVPGERGTIRFGCEHERRLRLLLFLQLSQRPQFVTATLMCCRLAVLLARDVHRCGMEVDRVPSEFAYLGIAFVPCSPIKSSAEWEGAASEPCRVSNVR